MTNTKQTQDDRTIQPFNRSTIQRVKAYAFTLAETLIVIGIIGVVAALTLPNLNHATGDKETATRLMKAYSMLNEANDRAVATYGPLSSWNWDSCGDGDSEVCYMTRLGEFLKISKSCNTYQNISCDKLNSGMGGGIAFQLADGITISNPSGFPQCAETSNDMCQEEINVDINGFNKGKNKWGEDIFSFRVYDSNGFVPYTDYDNDADNIAECLNSKDEMCTFWVIDYGNLDYLKADSEGKCYDNPSIILDGVNNTSCH